MKPCGRGVVGASVAPPTPAQPTHRSSQRTVHQGKATQALTVEYLDAKFAQVKQADHRQRHACVGEQKLALQHPHFAIQARGRVGKVVTGEPPPAMLPWLRK